ncbi:hypothetical protein SAMN02745898_108271, partial [Streptomyces sp. 136MFCol5.1]|uniref:hypothetical protein n=1 Tax=Streptomyces sp. 136MFCol5.1 TaxID=1172182 RepID=UPI000885F0E7
DSRTAMKETGKALVAWDEWGKNPGRAAGAVTFNVLTTVFTGGAGAGVSGAGKAGAVAKVLSVAGKAGKVIDPMTYIAKGAGAGLSKIGDITKGLKGIENIEIPKLPDDAIVLPEGALKLPDGAIHLPEGAAIPDGAVKLPDGNFKLPDDVPVLPEGATKLPTAPGAPARYFDNEYNLLDENGNVLQKVDDARVEGSPDINPDTGADTNTPHAETPSPVREPALVGAGAHTADATAHVGANAGDHAIRIGDGLGNDLGDIGRTGDNIPGADIGDNLPGGNAGNHLPGGGVGNHMPTGHAGDNLPGSHAGDLGHSPSASHEPPNSGSHSDRGSPVGHSDGSGTGGHEAPSIGSHRDGPAGSHSEGPGGGGQDSPGGKGPDGADSPADPHDWEKPRDESGPFERGGENEQQIRDQMHSSKVKRDDLDKVLANLADHPAGQEIADTIASGKFKDSKNFDQVVSSLSQADKMSGGVEQLRLANRLYESGVRDISFEIKGDVDIKPGVRTGGATDLDVMARDAGGNVHGYQFKEIQSPRKVVKKIFDNMKQLDESGADFKTFVVDTKGTLADHLALRTQQRLTDVYGNTNVQFIIRVEDGVLTIPPSGTFMPEGTL